MTETDLSQGPSANGKPGEGEQISGAAGERRSTARWHSSVGASGHGHNDGPSDVGST